MADSVYVQPLNEGSTAWRPVPAELISESVYRLGGVDFHDPDDEEWQFLPGALVFVEERPLRIGDTKKVLVALRAAES